MYVSYMLKLVEIDISKTGGLARVYIHRQPTDVRIGGQTDVTKGIIYIFFYKLFDVSFHMLQTS